MTKNLLGAIESGGTKFRVAVMEPDELQILDQVRIETTTPDETLGAAVEFFETHGPLASIGIASFGPLVVDQDSPSYGDFGPTPKPFWSSARFTGLFRDRFKVPVEIQTDVEAAAVAEHAMGAGIGKRSVGYVTVGTGIGAAVAIDGVPFRGRDHTEMGHIPVKRVPGDTFAGRCPFHQDCLEGMACGPAIEDRWQADPESLDKRDDVWDLEAAYLAQLVRVYTLTFVPDIILFGGGVGTRPDMASRIQAAAQEDIAGYSLSHSSNEDLVQTAGLGADAGLIGAGLLARSLTGSR